MVRQAVSTIGLLLLVAALLPTAPARAQFDNIFDNIFGNNRPPPRPPADIPDRERQPGYYPGQQYPRQYPQQYPRDPDQRAYPDYRDNPAVQRQPSVPAASRDEPPARPMPSPMNLPPTARPGGGTIETQPLAPPPGAGPDRQANTPDPASAANPAIPANPNAPAPQQQPATEQQANQPPAGQLPGGQLPATAGKPPAREVVVEPPPQRIDNPTAVFEGLDKITGRITSFDVAVNETVQFGALQVTPKACYSRPPTETPQTDAFVDVDEVTLKGEIKRIFTGWMFKASPGLHAVEHPIYDVWLIDCKGGKNPDVADASSATAAGQAGAAGESAAAEPAPRQAAPRPRPAPQPRGALPALR